MKVKYIDKSKLNSVPWSQGLTTEYYIYPTDCDYSNKDFIFRISSATIDSKPAVFTNFKGYNRYLAMLDSELILEINNSKHELEQYDIIDFHSEDNTISYSTGKDFNLMVSDKYNNVNLSLKNNNFTFTKDFGVIFALEKAEVFVDNNKYELEQYDTLILENDNKKEYNITINNDIFFASIGLL